MAKTGGVPKLQVDVRQVMDNLHGQYQGIIGSLAQENAQLLAGLENAQSRIAELEAQRAALLPAGVAG